MSTLTQQDAVGRDPRRWWALGALVASMLTLGFDTTILNVALPTMAGQLGAGTGQQQWMADAYVVVFAALMLPAGLLGDRFGRRRMLIAGLGIFLAGSLVGALAADVNAVVAARAVMGVGAALVTPLALSVLPSLFAPDERTKAVGIVSAGSTLGLPLGPILGGWLLDHFWWGSVFLVNVPMAGLGIAACVFLLPETSDPASPKVDAIATALTVTGLGALIYAIIEAPDRGWGAPLILAMLAAAVVVIVALVLRERRTARPMLDMALLAHRGFLFNTLAATLVMFVLSGLLFVLPPYLQTVLGHDALGTGVRLLPLMGGLLVAARAAQPVVARFGARAVVSTGLVVLAFAGFLGSRTTVDSGYGFTALWLSLAGAGFGFSVVPAMSGALGALPSDRAGSGSGLLMTLRQVGAAIGVAVLGSVLASAFRDRLDVTGLPARAADTAGESVIAAHLVAERAGAADLAASANGSYVHGMGLVLLVCGVSALVAALLAAAFLPGAPTARSSTGVAPDLAAPKSDARQ
ncbi:DHA2 family efflux MFS transporter permease subunit [Streptomyces ipomoeae]|uniref:Drug resistance MFS transporter, drug:H+ antiporter-2 (14 Spanner) (DHA2) family protein n=2 Tax=Streptomyces ipomoeae TaxID=103232 RepID=L1KNY8_9ACTN|nr:MFS transporter [Streptomyces ipomoeae]EKX62108.1 drug resistance MFS transporter, drug:H+ antiporter-2 (14 Spanner) (DHA2) family protein [Streptomyces ipomoeae 91-03]MDX2700057.1 MFS transporter [Streptomyces ipomoeae]MDX2823753.1 MFS transporter [Streptomyces ipomoeae]MDX2845692.1 MFS transporter [Streptomyces ipomoeae]MDX2874111.1 MFS transporter [Streptomyces ipomoeae]